MLVIFCRTLLQPRATKRMKRFKGKMLYRVGRDIPVGPQSSLLYPRMVRRTGGKQAGRPKGRPVVSEHSTKAVILR